MRTFIKTIRTITAVLMILAGLTVLFILDNANDLITLLTLAVIMVTGVVGGIAILVTTYPELTDLSEFDDKSLNALEECQAELDILREQNILLLDRYITFKAVLKSHKSADYSDMTSYPNLYHLIYVEDLTVTEEEVERFKEVYN